MAYVLYARKSWGSTIAEAGLHLARLPYELTGARGEPAKGIPPLKETNPLKQWPTLICPDGEIMTESAAILMHIGDVAPESSIVPPRDAPERRQFLRLLFMIAGNIYPSFTYEDYPGRFVSSKTARKELVENSQERRKGVWLQIEAAIDPTPWVLGTRFSGLDIYAGVMTRWGPRRTWFAAHCPKVMSAAEAAHAIPALAPVWKRNFGS